MAAVTVVRERRWVDGSKRMVGAKVNIAATGDTYDTKLKLIDTVSADGSGTTGIGTTVLGGVITFVTGGAENNVQVLAVGV